MRMALKLFKTEHLSKDSVFCYNSIAVKAEMIYGLSDVLERMQMLYKRSIEITEYLLSIQKPVTIETLAQRFSVSMRTVRNDLDSIDVWLLESECPPVQRVQNVGVFLQDPDGVVKSKLYVWDTQQYVFNKQERTFIIIGLLLGKRKTNINDLADLLDVSPATVSMDIQKVKEWLNEKHIKLVSTPHKGIIIDDGETSIRRGYVILLREIFNLKAKQRDIIEKKFTQCGDILNLFHLDYFRKAYDKWGDKILNAIEALKRTADSDISDGSFIFIYICFLVSLTMIQENRSLSGDVLETMRELATRDAKTLEAIKTIIKAELELDIPNNEAYYLTTAWSSTRRFEVAQNAGLEYVLLARELIKKVQEKIEYEINADEETVFDIATHLNLMHYRMAINIPAGNYSSLEGIASEFPDVCEASKQALLDVLKGSVFPENIAAIEDEAPYVAMHIVVSIYKQTLFQDNMRKVIIVCGSSVATSRILENRLKAMFSNINVMATMSYNEFLAHGDNLQCDLIVATINLESKAYKCITVSPLLKEEDINRLMNFFVLRSQDIEINKYIGATMNIMARALKLSAAKKLELTVRLVKELNGEVKKLKRKAPLKMRDILSFEVVETGVRVKDSIEAIQIAASLLIRSGAITQRHVDDLIKSYKRFGGSIVIDEGIAMPHLLIPELTAPCMSLITLKEPVKFNNVKNDPVSVVMVLLSNNNIAHVGVIEDIIELFNDEKSRKAVFNATSKLEIINQIHKK